jgi:hypothetical protein
MIVPDEGSSRKRDVCTLDISFSGAPVNIHQAATSCRQTLFCKALSRMYIELLTLPVIYLHAHPKTYCAKDVLYLSITYPYFKLY